MMKFGTFSVCVGTEACNAKCPFCVAKMTNGFVPGRGDREFHLNKLEIASRLASMSGVNTALLTGKGEPTLFHDEITHYLQILNKYFPLIELQSNGLNFLKSRFDLELANWVNFGLTHVALSIVHYENYMNGKIYCDSGLDYPALNTTIDFLVNFGLSVRLNCIGLKGYIDTVDEIKKLLDFVQETGHELQVTWRPVTIPQGCTNEVAEATEKLFVDKKNLDFIREYFAMSGILLYRLPHGAEIYDVNGQNFCLANCLTAQPDKDVIRQLIFTDGRLRYDWNLKGAIIL